METTLLETTIRISRFDRTNPLKPKEVFAAAVFWSAEGVEMTKFCFYTATGEARLHVKGPREAVATYVDNIRESLHGGIQLIME